MLSLNRKEKKLLFKEQYKNTLTKVQMTGYPSCPLPAFGELDPWEVLDDPKQSQKTNKKDSFLFLIHVVLVTIPRGEAPTLGCLVFPQICCPSRKPKNKYAENHKDKFGCLCGKAWSLGDYAHKKKER